MADTIYAVTRVHNQEQNMLARADIDRLLAAKTAPEVLRLLKDRGWGAPELPGEDGDALLEAERVRAWALVEELAGNLEPFGVLRLEADYHNLKAALKMAYGGHGPQDAARYMLPGGTVPAEELLKAAQTHDFSALPEDMAQTARKAYEALLHTSSGQRADTLIDAALLTALDRAGKASASPAIQAYARITLDAAVVKTALRAARMGLGRDFLEAAIPCAAGLNREALVAAALAGEEALWDLLRASPYEGAAAPERRSLPALERWFDDHLMEHLRPQRYVYEGVGPLVAYLVGREREIGAVRLILSAKANGLREGPVAERLRVLYG